MTESRLHVPSALQASFGGVLCEPQSGGYEELRRVHNGLIDRHPALIARCSGTADVIDAIEFARDAGAEIAVRGGGHNVAGRATGNGVVIDLSMMRGVHVDARRRLIHAGPGTTWRELDRAAHLARLATPGGTVSSTGVAGLTLGGGIGYLSPRFGLAADNLVEAEVVTADGRILVAAEDADADLLWALRGGGGNFGVVTHFVLQAHPLATVLGGLVAYSFSDAASVLAAFRTSAESASDEVGVLCALVHSPDGSGAKLAALPICHCGGDEQRAESEVKEFRGIAAPAFDLIERMPYPMMNTLLDGGFPRGTLNYWKSTYLLGLPADAIGALVAAYERVPSPMTALVVEYCHGAMTRVAPDATAFPHRSRGYNVLIAGQWTDPADTAANISWTKETFDSLRPWAADACYVNYLSEDDARRTHSAYGPNHERLVELKRRYDPTNLFRLNQNIDPG
ncbi:MAG: FAD-binding oxidoreductase [Acidimicrobiales bacterium]